MLGNDTKTRKFANAFEQTEPWQTKSKSKENRAEIRCLRKTMVLALLQKKNKKCLLGTQSEEGHLSKVCRNKLLSGCLTCLKR